jgi:hypothetical protein
VDWARADFSAVGGLVIQKMGLYNWEEIPER